MKKIAFIAFGGLLLFLTACSKEEIQPRSATDADNNGYVWKSATQGTGSLGGGSVSNDEGTITDPNNDEDSVGKKKKP